MSSPQPSKPSSSPSAAAAPPAFDVTQLTREDHEFAEWVKRKATINVTAGLVAGGAIPYFLTRRTSAPAHPVMRGVAVLGGAFAGVIVGGMFTSRQVTDRFATLDNNSYIKKIANNVLVDRFPMAVQDTMDQRKQQQQQQATNQTK